MTRLEQAAALLNDEDLALACYGREWGSIAFQFGRDDILNLSTRPRSELTEFLQRHHRTLLLVKPTADLRWFRSALPPGMQMIRLAESTEGNYAVIEPIRPDHPSDDTHPAAN